MTEFTRTIALQEAVKVAGMHIETQGDAAAVLKIAEQFHEFVKFDASTPPQASAPGKEPAVVKATPPAAPKKAAPAAAPAKAAPKAAPAKTEEEVVDEATATDADEAAPAATQKDCADAIAKLIKAGARDAAVGLLGEYGATKLSEVKPASYAAFVAKAGELMLGT